MCTQKLSPTFLWDSKFDVKLGSGITTFKIKYDLPKGRSNLPYIASEQKTYFTSIFQLLTPIIPNPTIPTITQIPPKCLSKTKFNYSPKIWQKLNTKVNFWNHEKRQNTLFGILSQFLEFLYFCFFYNQNPHYALKSLIKVSIRHTQFVT